MLYIDGVRGTLGGIRAAGLVTGAKRPCEIEEYPLARQHALQFDVLFDAVKPCSGGTKQHRRDPSLPQNGGICPERVVMAAVPDLRGLQDRVASPKTASLQGLFGGRQGIRTPDLGGKDASKKTG